MKIPLSEAVTILEDSEGSTFGSLDERVVSTEAGLAILGHHFKNLSPTLAPFSLLLLKG